MLGLAIEPERRGDEHKLAEALHKLAAEDPCVRVEHHASAQRDRAVRHGRPASARHDRAHDRALRRARSRPGRPAFPYRETITRPAEGHHRHKKQTGGAGQFGEVYLRIEPLARGTGFEFVDDVVGGAIPNQFIPAVEKGIRHALVEGAVAGFPMQDIRVSVYDGKYHSVDSKEVAFVSAGRKAFLDAVQQGRADGARADRARARSTRRAPSMGDITADLATRRARIDGNEARARGRIVVSAYVPLAEVTDYQNRLKALTGGEGSFTLELSHYDPVPPRKQQELASAWKPAAGRGMTASGTRSDTRIMAVFCDFENVALGVRDAKIPSFDIRKVLERLLLKGNIVVKKAYCNWERYKEFKGDDARGGVRADRDPARAPCPARTPRTSAWSSMRSTSATRSRTSTRS